MGYLYFLIAGAIMGWFQNSVLIGILVFIAFFAFHYAKSILFKKDINGVPTEYQLYLIELEKEEKPTKYPWLRFMGTGLIVDSLIYFVAFTITFLISK